MKPKDDPYPTTMRFLEIILPWLTAAVALYMAVLAVKALASLEVGWFLAFAGIALYNVRNTVRLRRDHRELSILVADIQARRGDQESGQ